MSKFVQICSRLGLHPLARDLLVSLDDLSEAEVERLWLEEAVRRDEEMASGKVQSIPMGEVFAELRSARK